MNPNKYTYYKSVMKVIQIYLDTSPIQMYWIIKWFCGDGFDRMYVIVPERVINDGG